MSDIPAIFTHMAHMYDELEKRAAPLDNGDTLKFEGSKVEAFRAIGVSQGYYTKIFDALTAMGCIEQVKRGSGRQGSVILLRHKPEYDEYVGIYEKRLTKPTELDTVRQQVKDLQRRLQGVDINGFILSFDRELTEIKARLDAIEGGKRLGTSKAKSST